MWCWVVVYDVVIFLYEVVFLYWDVFVFWYYVFDGLQCVVGRFDCDVVFVFVVFVKVYIVIQFGDDCVIFWVMGFEQFCYVGQIFGDVFGFGIFVWDLCYNVIGFDFLFFFDGQNGVY